LRALRRRDVQGKHGFCENAQKMAKDVEKIHKNTDFCQISTLLLTFAFYCAKIFP
jgi:hypothetical protein